MEVEKEGGPYCLFALVGRFNCGYEANRCEQYNLCTYLAPAAGRSQLTRIMPRTQIEAQTSVTTMSCFVTFAVSSISNLYLSP